MLFVGDREGKRAVGKGASRSRLYDDSLTYCRLDGPWTEEVPSSQILEDCKGFNDTCKELLKVRRGTLPSSLNKLEADEDALGGREADSMGYL